MVIQIDLNSGRVEVRNSFPLNFEQKQHADRSLDANAKHLIDILSEDADPSRGSCEGFSNLLALSGGLDSRIVMLAMRKTSLRFLLLRSIAEALQHAMRR